MPSMFADWRKLRNLRTLANAANINKYLREHQLCRLLSYMFFRPVNARRTGGSVTMENIRANRKIA